MGLRSNQTAAEAARESLENEIGSTRTLPQFYCLANEQDDFLQAAYHKCLLLRPQHILERHNTQPIYFYTRDELKDDKILHGAATRRLLSRAANFAPTPRIKNSKELWADLDRFQYRVMGKVLGILLSAKPPGPAAQALMDLQPGPSACSRNKVASENCLEARGPQP